MNIPEISGMDDWDWQWRKDGRELNNEPPECPDCRGRGQRLKLKERGYGYEHAPCEWCEGTGLKQPEVADE